MKKIIRLLALSAAIMMLPFVANAQSTATYEGSPWYAGVEGTYLGVSGNGKFTPDTLYGTNAFVGYSILPNIAVEIGYVGAWGSEKALNESIQGGSANLVVFLPLYADLSLFATGGPTYLQGHAQVANFSADSYQWGWSGGGGAQLALTDHMALRLTGRWMGSDFHNTVDGGFQAAAGVVVRF